LSRRLLTECLDELAGLPAAAASTLASPGTATSQTLAMLVRQASLAFLAG